MGDNGKRLWERCYTAETMAAEYESLYNHYKQIE